MLFSRHTKRREFISLLGGSAAAAWPLAARAQQSPMPVIGFLRSTSLADAAHLVAAFRQGLKETGFIEGQNVAIEYRSAEDQADRLQVLVADLVRRQVALIVGNTPSAFAAKAATTTVPIVFATGGDPVRDGLVASLSRPGGNVTGVSFLNSVLAAKRLELLHQLVPKATKIAAILENPISPDTGAERRDLLAAAQAIGQQLIVLNVSSDREIETAFATLVQRGAGTLYAGTGAFLNSQRERIVALAARHGVPAIYNWREAVAAGGLISYAPSITDAYRQAGIYAGRILKGEKTADLPVMLPTKFELVINLKTAKALGLTVPDKLLALADEVIE
jgi:putative tryptophan/tyrosine transport system substrate-binding protein